MQSGIIKTSQQLCQVAEPFSSSEVGEENNVYVVVDDNTQGLSRCENCEQLEKRVSAMESYFANKMSEVPDELWSIFPERGEYIKNILQFSGYETLEAILKLKNENELTKIFEFIQKVYDVIEDKKSMLGIFATIPEKLSILPGLEPVLQKFIRSAEALASLRREKDGESSEETDNSDLLVNSAIVKLATRKRNRPNRVVDEDSLTTQLLHWIYRNKPHDELSYTPSEMFCIRATENYEGFTFTCFNCGATVALAGPSQGKISLSNSQRHIKTCWLYGRKIIRKKSSGVFKDEKNLSASMVKNDHL